MGEQAALRIQAVERGRQGRRRAAARRDLKKRVKRVLLDKIKGVGRGKGLERRWRKQGKPISQFADEERKLRSKILQRLLEKFGEGAANSLTNRRGDVEKNCVRYAKKFESGRDI